MYKCEVETPENGTQWVLMMPGPEVQIDLDREQRPNVFRDSPRGFRFGSAWKLL